MTVKKRAEGYITPLRMNKLHGRMMRLPPKKNKREILLVYGHHASLERAYGFAEFFNRYGAVTVPDLPGFGGMESFYKIGKEPDIDTMADYLASFIKLQYKRRRVSIVCTSFSMLVVTRMLQRYPSVTKKVDLLISYVGFVHKDDFRIRRSYYWGLYALSIALSGKIPAAIMRTLFMRRRLLKLVLKILPWTQYKSKDISHSQKQEMLDFEAELWQINDFRTRFRTVEEMLTADLCDKSVPLPVYQVSVKGDRYFDDKVVEQHMRIIYKDFEMIKTDTVEHAPSVLASKKDIARIMPNRIRQLLRK